MNIFRKKHNILIQLSKVRNFSVISVAQRLITVHSSVIIKVIVLEEFSDDME